MVEEEIKKLIIERYGSVAAFSDKVGLPNSTMDSILRRGLGKANVENVMRICKELQISIDGLRHGIIKPVTFKNISQSELAFQTKYLISITEGLSEKKKQHLLSTIELTCYDDDDSR